MWKVRCTQCGYSEDCEDWRTARGLAIFHAEEFDHWRRVVLSRPVDAAVLVLTPWGMERQLRSLKKVA